MNTQETEKKIFNLIEYKIKDTLLNLIYDMASKPEADAEYIIPQSIINIKNSIAKAYAKLDSILDTTDREEYEKELGSIQNEIIKSAQNLNKYVSVNDNLGERLLKCYKLNDVKNVDSSIPLNNSAMTQTINEFTAGLNDNELPSQFKMADIIAVIPLRMTKEKYNDYIAKSINLLTKGLTEEFASSCIDRLKDMLFTDIDDDFKADFPLMCEKLNAVKEDVKNLSDEELTDAFEDIDGNISGIQSIYALLGIYYNDVTYMNILSMFAVDSEFLFSEDMVLKDLYYSLKDVIDTGDASFLEDIYNRAENEIEDRFEISKPLEKEISEKMEGLKEEEFNSLSDDIKTAINVNDTISEMFYSEIDDALILSGYAQKDTDKAVAELIEYINEKTADMENSDRKFAKQVFLKHIPCPMSKDEFGEYCRYALDGINSRELSLITYGDIFRITDEDDEHSEHHHHHDHCTCGHEHHHHDHCDCGHEHHHH